MKKYEYDAFGNPVKPLNGKPRPTTADTAHLHSDGVYDPALALYYQPVQPHSPLSGLFTIMDNHPGPIHDPASLTKFLYAGHSPVDFIDPA